METGHSDVGRNGCEGVEIRVPISEEPRASVVRVEDLNFYWPRVVEWLRRALAEAVHHELNIQDIYRRCRAGDSLMVVMAIGQELCGVAVLDYSVDPKGDGYVLVYACGGERMPQWIGLFVKTCRAIALDRGARRLLMVGRKGWQPFLQAQGARLRCICMSMEV
jgi:hypothetical protein